MTINEIPRIVADDGRFLTAGQSRAPLRITRDMFSLICTFYQVPPSFLDFVFPFGMREHAQDFHFSGLREECRLASYDKGCALPDLNRSGRDLRFCYNLRSVEPSKSQPDLPWSIRQCAVYHSFDVDNGQMSWIIVKGNKDMKDRITEASRKPTRNESLHESRSNRFAASLETHLMLCNWSGENWRWYINDLEDKLQALTRGALAFPVEKPPTLVSSPHFSKSMSPHLDKGSHHNLSQMSPVGPPSRSFTPSSFLSGRTLTKSNTGQSKPQSYKQRQRGDTNQSSDTSASLPTANSSKKVNKVGRWHSAMNYIRGSVLPLQLDTVHDIPLSGGEKQWSSSVGSLATPKLQPSSPYNGLDKTPDMFTFRNLQDIQYIEEKAQEAMLVLKLNTEVLEQLRLHYDEVTNHDEFPREMLEDCSASLHQFCKGVIGVEKDLRMLQSRTETLLILLANRKTLVSTVFSYSYCSEPHSGNTMLYLLE